MSGKNKKKRTFADVLLTLILVAAIGVFCFAGVKLGKIYLEYKAGSDEYSDLADLAVTTNDTEDSGAKERDIVDMEAAPDPNAPVKAPIKVDFDALRAVNEDVIGWIYVEALADTINYPVVHGKDNDEYLHMTYHRNYNFAGTIFIDCANNTDFNDCNTLVYGHNMKNGSMFGLLKRFVSTEKTYEDSKYFWILTPTKNYRYEIIAAYTTGVTSDTYTLFDNPGEKFEDYLRKISTRSEIKTTPGDLTIDDRIVTLSTCTGNYATRFVVQGKRVDEVDVE
ncbi:MAG: class B sortase [Clostridiales bacterium]|nr:class B sortase [Candidatus Blautia equi]